MSNTMTLDLDQTSEIRVLDANEVDEVSGGGFFIPALIIGGGFLIGLGLAYATR